MHVVAHARYELTSIYLSRGVGYCSLRLASRSTVVKVVEQALVGQVTRSRHHRTNIGHEEQPPPISSL